MLQQLQGRMSVWGCEELRNVLSEGRCVDLSLHIAAHNDPLGNLDDLVGGKMEAHHASCCEASAQVIGSSDALGWKGIYR